MTELTAHNCICLSDYFKPLFFRQPSFNCDPARLTREPWKRIVVLKKWNSPPRKIAKIWSGWRNWWRNSRAKSGREQLLLMHFLHAYCSITSSSGTRSKLRMPRRSLPLIWPSSGRPSNNWRRLKKGPKWRSWIWRGWGEIEFTLWLTKKKLPLTKEKMLHDFAWDLSMY